MKEEIYQIIEFYNNKLTLNQIGNIIGKSREYVRKVLIKNNIGRRLGKENILNIFQEEEIIKKYSSGICPVELAKEYSVGKTLIYRTFKKYGISADRFTLKAIPKNIQIDICEKYKSGYSLGKIFKEEGLSKSSSAKIIRSNNVKIRPSDIARKKFLTKRDYFEKINTLKKAYIFGLLLSDGCLHKGRINLSLQTCDKYMLEIVSKNLFVDKTPKLYKNPKSNCFALVISDKKISKDLKNIGLIEKKSLILEYPNSIPTKFFGHFLRGYFDGDGCIYFNEKTNAKSFIITSGSINFLKVLRLKIEERIKENLPEIYTHKNGWHEIRSGKTSVIKKIYEIMYPDNIENFFLTRKKEKFEKLIASKNNHYADTTTIKNSN